MNFHWQSDCFLSEHAASPNMLSIKAIILYGRFTFYVLFPGSQTKCHITAFISRHGRVDLMYSSCVICDEEES